MRKLFLLLLLALALTTTAPPAQAAPDLRTVTWGSSVSLREAQLRAVGVVNLARHDDVQPDGEIYSGSFTFTVVSLCWRVKLATESYGVGWQQGYCLYFPLAGTP